MREKPQRNLGRGFLHEDEKNITKKGQLQSVKKPELVRDLAKKSIALFHLKCPAETPNQTEPQTVKFYSQKFGSGRIQSSQTEP